jgi:hypothetical protein
MNFPLTGSLRSPPLPHFVGERNRSFGDWRFLSPGQGERWFAKQTGEGVFCNWDLKEDHP